MKVFKQAPLLVQDVLKIQIFTRESAPDCTFIQDTKEWLKNCLPDVPIEELTTTKNPDEWRKLLRERPETRTIPQVIFIMKNGAKWHFGGFPRLLKAFSDSHLE